MKKLLLLSLILCNLFAMSQPLINKVNGYGSAEWVEKENAGKKASSEINVIKFYGYEQWNYQGPIGITPGKYKPRYQRGAENRIKGKITIYEKMKMFSVYYSDGIKDEAKILKQEIKQENDTDFGVVTKYIYLGVWVDDQQEVKLVITKTKSNGCITQIHSRRVIDDQRGIDCYKIITTYATGGGCFE